MRRAVLLLIRVVFWFLRWVVKLILAWLVMLACRRVRNSFLLLRRRIACVVILLLCAVLLRKKFVLSSVLNRRCSRKRAKLVKVLLRILLIMACLPIRVVLMVRRMLLIRVGSVLII